jgi:hypothetical protein
VGFPAGSIALVQRGTCDFGGPQVHLKTDTNENRTTYNEIAGTPPG